MISTIERPGVVTTSIANNIKPYKRITNCSMIVFFKHFIAIFKDEIKIKLCITIFKEEMKSHLTIIYIIQLHLLS
jgi:hypothetical protein